MEEILEHVKKLSVDELRSKLKQFGEKEGPIGPTTKLLFQKRLARKIFNDSGLSTSEAEQSKTIDQSNDESVHNKVPNESTSGDEILSSPNGFLSKTSLQSSAETSERGTLTDNVSIATFYGVSLPNGTDNAEGNELVYADKDQALKVVKKYSGARFKVFKTKTEAERFSLQPAEEICPSPWKPNGNKSDNGAISTLGTGVSVESSPFKGPKSQDLNKLRKAIEEGDVVTVEALIWDNPRYLVSGGDTPVILQEGSRYNALHVAAKANQGGMCQLVLDTLEDPSFMDKLYGHTMETDSTRTNRINFVIDLYLNTPDKGSCESPLHFACKFGFPEVVAVLVAHPKTDKFLKNKYGEIPRDIICTRSSNATEIHISEIKELLEGQFFVPLIRSEDNTTQPVIGTPWSPEYSRGGGVGTPPTSWSPKDPLMAVKACAGPMTPAKAHMFHKRWTTPPSGSPDYVKRKFVMTKREDSEKGLERIGRELAHELNIPWVEYWDFLQTYADLSNDDGLDLLEEYLQKQSLALCVEEAFGKLQLLSNSNHSFMYNQMNASQQNGSLSSMTSSWLMSPLEGIVESHHESLGDVHEITNQDLLERLQNDRPNGSVANGTPPRMPGDPMKRSFRMDESFSTPVRNIYDYGWRNRSMEWSMDSSDWSQDSISGNMSPISCLSALFSKLSLLDRSRRQKRLSGLSAGCFSVSCMGQGYPGVVKSTLRERTEKGGKSEETSYPEKMEEMGTIQTGCKDAKQMENSLIKEARLVLGDKNQNDIKNKLDYQDKRAVSFQDRKDSALSVPGDDCLGVKPLSEANSETNCEVRSSAPESHWRDTTRVSSTSSDCDTECNVSMDLVVPSDCKLDEHESISDLISQFDKNISLANAKDSSVMKMTDLDASLKTETSVKNIDHGDTSVKKKSEAPIKKSLFGKDKNAMCRPAASDVMSCSTLSTASTDLKVLLELDKDKVSSLAYQSMFEILNERKNLENLRSGDKRRVIYSRDIILNLAGVDLDSSPEILVTVVIVPPNSTVAEMTVFSRIPFSVVYKEDHRQGDAALSRLPAMIDVNFNFGKNCVTSALAVNNRSRGKIFFVNGYQPCKMDLDVYRAMRGVEVDKESHPLVHRWKSLVSSRVANPSCSWPSPARMHHHGNLSASFPQVSTPRQTPAESPIVFYRSPVARTPTRQKMSSTWSMPNIKSQLFPPRSPHRDAHL